MALNSATERLAQFVSSVVPGQHPLDKIMRQNPDDVVITLAIRTPLCKGKTGGMRELGLDEIILKMLQEVVKRMDIDPSLVEDICLGNVRDGKAAYYLRAAMLAAGFPVTTGASAVARFCSSGLTATQNVANAIAAGEIDIGVAIGAESASVEYSRLDRPFVDDIMRASQDAVDIMQPMGQTSENVGREFDISRERQDRYAEESYCRAEVAQKAGWFDDEIVPIHVMLDGKPAVLTRDEGPRWGTTYEKLSRLKPSFAEHGDRSTAGNSSQVTDGAAAVVLMKRSRALELRQPILGKFVGATVAGLAPRIMGIGPTIVIPKLLRKYGIGLDEIDVIEINEAFASMAVYCRDEMRLDWSKLNPRGGAIALGHPFGCTGVRQIVTGLSECRRRRQKILLTSMCLGTGMGMAALFVNEQQVD